MGAAAKRAKREEFRQKVAKVTTESGEGSPATVLQLPQKRYYRQRAHANPFSDHLLDYPLTPAHMDWSTHFPAFVNPDSTQKTLSGSRKLLKDVEVVDIGCGFGGLLVGLAPVLPDTLMVGMEIRAQVAEYLTSRIHALRFQQTHLQHSSTTTTTTTTTSSSSSDPNLEKLPPVPSAIPTTEESDTAADSPPSEQVSTVPGGYQNISALRANTMKFFPNFFARGQLSKIFICFPDPHFKTRKHKARIVSESLNAEYAYSLRPGGLLYTITDVEEYHYWILRHFKQDDAEGPPGGSGDATAPAASGTVEKLPGVEELFERLTEEELRLDECVRVMMDSTEEGKKVTRNKGNKYVAVFRRKADPEWPLDDDDDNGCI